MELNMNAHLLSDRELLRFITHGYHLIKLKDVPEVHKEVCRQTARAFDRGNPFDRIWNAAPAMRDVFEHPITRGALASLLGPDYTMYSHRHCHLSPSGHDGGKNHQDGTERNFAGWHRPWRRHFRARTVMAIYYPHKVSIENGPTGVIPGSQYVHALTDADEDREVPVCGKAGTIALVHFDIWHRATANISDQDRVMMKFLFKRTSEPAGPTWQADASCNPDFRPIDQLPYMPLVWEDMWRWHKNTPWTVLDYDMNRADLTKRLFEDMAAQNEIAAVNAAYTLGCLGLTSVSDLIDILNDAPQTIRERIPVALSAAGAAAIEPLTRSLYHADPWVRASAADTLGDIGIASAEALPALRKSLQDKDPWVRHNAAETLGIWGRAAMPSRDDLIAVLSDEEPFVRFNALTALYNLSPENLPSISDLEPVLQDPNARVRHHANELMEPAA